MQKGKQYCTNTHTYAHAHTDTHMYYTNNNVIMSRSNYIEISAAFDRDSKFQMKFSYDILTLLSKYVHEQNFKDFIDALILLVVIVAQ